MDIDECIHLEITNRSDLDKDLQVGYFGHQIAKFMVFVERIEDTYYFE